MCISRATVSAVSCLVVPAFICIDLLISLVLKINDDDDDDDNVNVAALFGVLFYDDQEAAFSCYRTFQTLGLVAAFISSTGDRSDDVDDVVGGLRWPPCLSTKLYIMSVLLAISLVLYAAAEYTLPRRSRLIAGTGDLGTRSVRPSLTRREHSERRRVTAAGAAASDPHLVLL